MATFVIDPKTGRLVPEKSLGKNQKKKIMKKI